MKVKKRSWQSLLFMVVTILALMMPQTVFATGGTDGTELQVAEPASLEIQLGEEWAGVEFELKTDAGMYPGDVVVGDDGVLRLEIGGSKSYILTCMNSSVAVPDPEQAPATTEESSESSVEKTENTSAENTVAGIPAHAPDSIWRRYGNCYRCLSRTIYCQTTQAVKSAVSG